MPLVGRRSDETKRREAYALRTFYRVAGYKSTYTKADVERAVERLEKLYRPSYVNRMVLLARRAADGWPDDVKYVFSRFSGRRISLKPSAIQAMISTAKSASTSAHSHLKAYLALSTVFGLRAKELRSIRQDDVNLGERSIFIRTAKGGIERYHLIPDAIVGYLEGVAFEPITEDQMIVNYRMVEALSGIEHQAGAGWHSIRRAVATALTEVDVSKVKAVKFLRWRDPSVYESYVHLEWRSADREIFEVHPFLKMWEAKNA